MEAHDFNAQGLADAPAEGSRTSSRFRRLWGGFLLALVTVELSGISIGFLVGAWAVLMQGWLVNLLDYRAGDFSLLAWEIFSTTLIPAMVHAFLLSLVLTFRPAVRGAVRAAALSMGLAAAGFGLGLAVYWQEILQFFYGWRGVIAVFLGCMLAAAVSGWMLSRFHRMVDRG